MRHRRVAVPTSGYLEWRHEGKSQRKINELKEGFENASGNDNFIDLTRTSYPYHVGTRHPLLTVKKEICDIFARLGFSIAEGPEIEDDWHVFTSLNFAISWADSRGFRDARRRYFTPNTYFVGSNAGNGKNTTANPYHLSGTGVSQ